jgi:DNA-binding transcriptional MerR regulator
MREATANAPELRVLSRELREVGKRFYTVSELIRLSGITRKQATYWAQIDLLRPTMHSPEARGKNPAYFYSTEDAVRALLFCELKRRGFSPSQIKQVSRNLKKDGVRLERAAGIYLLTDGYSVYYAANDHEAVDILRHHRQMLLLVPIHEHVKKLREAA